MNRVLKLAVAVMFATYVASWQLKADVVNVTQGSTSGYTMTDGNTYVIQNSVSFSNSTAGGSGMSVGDNATVVLYVPAGVTLTATGANGTGQSGGGAGIRVPSGATLVMIGEGYIVAKGGDAANGGNGGTGGAGSAYINSETDLGGTGGRGGTAGAGGRGAGAGIGGSSKCQMGTCYILGSINVTATGGSRGSYGTIGNARGASLDKVKRTDGNGYWFCAAGGGGGGGSGGPGGAGSSIGAGGGDGSSGSPGEAGHVSRTSFYYNGSTPPSYLYSWTVGASGSPGSAGSNGNENSGTLYVSATATVNVSRTKKSASSHPAAQYMIEFDPNGGELCSSQSYAIATIGCPLPDCVEPPTRPEYDFCGWSSSTDGGIEYYAASCDKMLGSYTVVSNITLFAQWTKKPIFVDVGGKPLAWNGIDEDIGWHLIADDTVADGFSLRSGEIESGQNSVVEAIFTGKGSLSFVWKIDAGRSDKLLFMLDGVELDEIPAISRFTDWVKVTIDVPDGDHVVKWVYEQFSTNNGVAWIDSVVWRPECILTVARGLEGATPSTGEHAYLWGSNVTVSVPAFVENNGIRHKCSGWTGTGSAPAAGEATNVVTFIIEEPSTVAWSWMTECKIDFLVEGPIITESSNLWVAQGEVATVSWNQSAEFVRLSLSGDVDGVIMNEKDRTLKIPVDCARTVSLVATEVTLADALDSKDILWNSVGERRWSPQFVDALDGVDAVRSGDALGADSVLEASFSGAGTFSWSWKLDGTLASGIDVELDGDLVLTKTGSFNWCTEEITVTSSGQHKISFVFWNEGVNASDCACIDQVLFKAETQTTPIPVPCVWIENQAASFLAEYGANYEEAANATAANGRNKVWECYVAGISPTNETAQFTAKIEMKDGAPIVTWEPDLNENGAKSERIYKIYGRETLENGGEWQYPTNSLHKFFKVEVLMK